PGFGRRLPGSARQRLPPTRAGLEEEPAEWPKAPPPANRQLCLRPSWLETTQGGIDHFCCWLYRCSILAISLAVCSAHAASPSPCAITTWAERPARKSGQRLSFSIQMRTGTRWTTLVNSPDTTFRGNSANWAPVDLLIQTTRPLNG